MSSCNQIIQSFARFSARCRTIAPGTKLYLPKTNQKVLYLKQIATLPYQNKNSVPKKIPIFYLTLPMTLKQTAKPIQTPSCVSSLLLLLCLKNEAKTEYELAPFIVWEVGQMGCYHGIRPAKAGIHAHGLTENPFYSLWKYLSLLQAASSAVQSNVTGWPSRGVSQMLTTLETKQEKKNYSISSFFCCCKIPILKQLNTLKSLT